MLRRRLLRIPIDTHNQQQELDEIFTSLQTMLELHENLLELAKQSRDPIIQKAYQDTRREIVEKLKLLYGRGVSVVDLVKKFGGLLVKSKILQAQELVQKTEDKQGEIVLTDLVSEDQVLKENNLQKQVLQLGKDLRLLPQKDTLGAFQKNQRLQEILTTTQARINVEKQIQGGIQEAREGEIEIQEIEDKESVEEMGGEEKTLDQLISEAKDSKKKQNLQVQLIEKLEEDIEGNQRQLDDAIQKYKNTGFDEGIIELQLQLAEEKQKYSKLLSEFEQNKKDVQLRNQQKKQKQENKQKLEQLLEDLAFLQKQKIQSPSKIEKLKSEISKFEQEIGIKSKKEEEKGEEPVSSDEEPVVIDEEPEPSGEDVLEQKQKYKDIKTEISGKKAEMQKQLDQIKNLTENLLMRKQRLPAEIESYRDTVRGRKVSEFLQTKIVGEGEATPYEKEVYNIIMSFTPEVGQVRSWYKKLKKQITQYKMAEKQRQKIDKMLSDIDSYQEDSEQEEDLKKEELKGEEVSKKEEELKINEATQKAGKKLQNEFLDYYKEQYAEDYKKVSDKVQKKGLNKSVDDHIIERLVAYQFGQIAQSTASQTLSTQIIKAFDVQLGSKLLKEKIQKLKEEDERVDIDILSVVSSVQKKKKIGGIKGGTY